MPKTVATNDLSTRRAEIGQERRNKTRDRLIRAALQVVAEHGFDIPVIDDFIQAAQVSRGTFYNYFNTKDELVAALCERINAERVKHHNHIRAQVEDTAERLVVGVRLNLRRARLHPDWGRVYAQERVRHMGGDLTENKGPKRDIKNAMDAGRLPQQPVGFALAMFYAVLNKAMTLAIADNALDDLDERVAAFVLAGLGMPFEEAKAVASRPLPEDVPDQTPAPPKPRTRRRRSASRPARSEPQG